MNKNKVLTTSVIAGMLFAFAAALLVNANLQKEYKHGDYVFNENAYFVERIDDPTGFVKAHKFITPTDNKYNTQKTRSLGTSLIGDIESVWNAYTGEGTKVAIIDDGFDYTHPEYTRSDGTSAILSTSRYYYVSGSSVLYQSYSTNPASIGESWNTEYNEWDTHGTATSTTAAAPMNNGGGVGIAPDADILALKIDFSFAAIDAAIKYAITQDVDVINMSLGAYAQSFEDGFGDSQTGSSGVATYLQSACQQAYDAGIIVVAAAGNEATDYKSYPACNYKVIGVGAIGDWDSKGNADALAEFTNYVGASQTGEINVDILAPGYVYTAHKTGTQSSPTRTYEDTQGTSFSSPIIAGAACLWKEKFPNGTPDQFLTQLQSSADGKDYYASKMVPVSGWYSRLSDAGPSNITNGRLNVANLMNADDPYVTTVQSSLSISVGEQRQIDLDTYNGTITYSSGNTSVATVNSSGLVEGKGPGSTTITVTATKNSKTATDTVSVTVDSAVATTSIAFEPKSVTLNTGQTYNAEETITVTPSNASRIFLFDSSNDSVATVNEDTGVVTAVGAGTASIDVISVYGEGDDTLAVTVTAISSGTYTIGWGTASGENGTFTNFSAVSGTAAGFLSYTTAQNNASSAPAYNDSSKELRLYYASNGSGCSITIAPLAGMIYTGFEITTSSGYSPTVKYAVNGGSATSISASGTAYSVSNLNISSSLTIQNGNTTNTQLRILTIALTYADSNPSDKIIHSLSASYTGGNIYVGGSLNEAAVSVTATYTDSVKYPSAVLSSGDYSLSGFSSSSAGQKTVTVTYTGSLETSASPMTTTFNVTVIADAVTDVSVTNNTTYHPGETISKSEITVTLTYASGTTNATTDFSFSSDGYQFTYADTNSGGSNKSKQFSIIYDSVSYSFSVNVSRNAYQTPSGEANSLSGTEFNGSTVSKSSGTPSSTSVTIDSINFTVTTNAYIYQSCLSFGKAIGSINNTNAFERDLTSVSIVQKSGFRQDGVIAISKDNQTWVTYSSNEVAKGGYRYFKVAYTSTSSLYSNITSISYTLSGQDSASNVANYVMYEDTTNQCTTKFYLAIDKLNTMSSADKEAFWTSADYAISTARERLLAWARHEGKTLTYSDSAYRIIGSSNIPSLLDVNQSSPSILVVVIAMLGLASFGGYLFLRIKKEH